MAQDSAEYTPTHTTSPGSGGSQPDDALDIPVDTGELSEPPPSMASIDTLLALPDEGWDIDDQVPQRFPAQLAVQSANEPGTLAQITQVIAEHDGNIDNINMVRQSPDFTDITIDLAVYNLKHLTSIISQLRAKKVVASAERVSG